MFLRGRTGGWPVRTVALVVGMTLSAGCGVGMAWRWHSRLMRSTSRARTTLRFRALLFLEPGAVAFRLDRSPLLLAARRTPFAALAPSRSSCIAVTAHTP